MTATAHTLVAGAIAQSIPDPIIAASLSFASHFLLDCIPHWDFGTDWRMRSKTKTGIYAITDTLIGLAVGWYIFSPMVQPTILIPSLLASVLPDWLEAPWYIFFAKHTATGPGKKASVLERITYGIYKIENTLHTKTTFPWGVFTQVAAVTFFWILLVK